MSGRRRVVIAAFAATVLALGGACTSDSQTATRQDDVERRGESVMPFDQRRTTHIFESEPDGGRQRVVAKGSDDARQVERVRGHLRDEAERFARGDFTDPMAIHGMKMPGIKRLRSGARGIEVTYSEIPRGARIVYRTTEPPLVRALHAWFDAQLMDHGNHAHD